MTPQPSRHPRESGDPASSVLTEPGEKLGSRFRGNDEEGSDAIGCGQHEQGFTLVELMVVIVIIGLLTTIVAINVIPALGTGERAKAEADVAVLEQALEQYRLDNLVYPAGADGLRALVQPPDGLARPERYRRGGYIKELPQDPWGRPYLYTVPGRSGAFDVYSLGADGAEGGEGENADIGGWR